MVTSDTRVFVSHPPGAPNPPPRGPTFAPPKTFVSLLMNVDFPHPESAATPITITFSSTPSTIDNLPYDADAERCPVMWDLVAIDAKGAKPIALVTATKQQIARIMVKSILICADEEI